MPRKVSSLLLAAQAAALIVLAGCGQPSPVDTPPSTYQDEPQRPPPPPPPPLAGGPTTGPYEMPVGSGLAPNPEDAPAASGLQTWREADGRLVTAMAPIPDADETAPVQAIRSDDLRDERGRDHPRARVPAAEPLRRVPAPPPPKTVAPSPAPVKARPPASPTLSTTVSPTLKAVQTPAARLTAELTPVITAGAKLSVPEAIAAGDPAAVTLTLPANLLATVQAEANALDLQRAARTVEVTAALSGDGYDVTPGGPQTLTLKPDEGATFTWQVTPRALKAKPLTAKVDAALTGGRSPFDFALGSVEAPVGEADSATAGGLDGMIDAPGIGRLPARTLLGGGLILLALIVLGVLARRASAWESAAAARRRAEREARAERD